MRKEKERALNTRIAASLSLSLGAEFPMALAQARQREGRKASLLCIISPAAWNLAFLGSTWTGDTKVVEVSEQVAAAVDDSFRATALGLSCLSIETEFSSRA